MLAPTSSTADDQVFPAVEAGALAYTLKGSGADDLVRAIDRIYRGEPSLEPEIARGVLFDLAHAATQRVEREPSRQLSSRSGAFGCLSPAFQVYWASNGRIQSERSIHMRIGVISDPHGCLVALRAALDWLAREGIDTLVCAGDVANFGPQPNECVSLLAEGNILTVQGNCDRDLLQASPAVLPVDERGAQLAAINDWCGVRLTSASRRWLAALPPMLVPAPGVLMVHGGVDGPEDIVDAQALPVLPPRVSAVAAGHLHVPFVIRTGQGIWVNAGSTGRPCDGDPRGALAVLEQGSIGWTASIHRFPFDLDAAVRAIRRAKMPHAERLVETQKNACWW